MRIAVPITNGQFSQHFGQSTSFWVCDVQQSPPAISEGRELAMPEGGGCSVIPVVLSQAGVNVVIAGGIGAGAVQNLRQHGIEAIAGVAPASPQQLATDYVAGRLIGSGQMCQQHEEHGQQEHGEHGHACHRQGAAR